MAPVSLAELTDVADMPTRRDRKYLLPRRGVPGPLDSLPAGTRVLTIDGKRTFRYESVYFDTSDLVSYLGAARCRPGRFKVRTRTYVDSDLCQLEVKTRDRRGRTVKQRLLYLPADRHRLTPAARQFLAGFDPVAPYVDELGPALTTRYQRTTLLLPNLDARVTVDVDLAWESTTGATCRLPDAVLIETKTVGPPCALDRTLWLHHHRPLPISKYGTGFAALNPTVPAHKWHRTLRRHFRAEPETSPDGRPGCAVSTDRQEEDASSTSSRGWCPSDRCRDPRGGDLHCDVPVSDVR